jgi:hypothetical protein
MYFIIKDDIFLQNSRFHFLLYKNKNIIAKLKNKNGGLIQDGAENIFYFSNNKPPF